MTVRVFTTTVVESVVLVTWVPLLLLLGVGNMDRAAVRVGVRSCDTEEIGAEPRMLDGRIPPGGTKDDGMAP